MNSNPNYINQEDFERIICAIPRLNIRKWKNDDVIMLMKIMYNMALRPMEAIIRNKEDFDVRNRYVYLGKTKTSTSDRAVIPRIFQDELESWLNGKDDGPLFPGLSYRTFWVWCHRLGEKLDIDAWKTGNSARMHEKTVGHIFRKSWGKDKLETMGYEKIDVISSHLRHKKPSMTFDHYLKGNIKKVHDSI